MAPFIRPTEPAAHYLADHRGQIDRRDAETVAEGAAFVVMAHHGFDTGGYSFPYLAPWAQEVAVLKRNVQEVQRVAHLLITAIAGTPGAGGDDVAGSEEGVGSG